MSEAEGHDEPLTGRLLKGRYLVAECIGEGGMGAAWLAEDTDLRRSVVVKAPRAEALLDRQFRVRFEREVQHLLGIDHPHVTKVLDAGVQDGLPFLVLPFLSGGSLEERLRASEQPLGMAAMLAWLPDIARALDFMHRRGFVHRDVKPANILFDESGHAFLGDFGIARAIEGADVTLTQAGTIIGSPRYMAPEVAVGRTALPASDQYSLGTIAYVALSGCLPHEGDTPLAIVAQKTLVAPRPLAEVARGVPREVERAIMRALEREPEARHANCESFANALVGAASAAGATDWRPAAAEEQAEVATQVIGRSHDDAATVLAHRASLPVARVRTSPLAGSRPEEPRRQNRLPVVLIILGLAGAACVAAWFGLNKRGQATVPTAGAPEFARAAPAPVLSALGTSELGSASESAHVPPTELESGAGIEGLEIETAEATPPHVRMLATESAFEVEGGSSPQFAPLPDAPSVGAEPLVVEPEPPVASAAPAPSADGASAGTASAPASEAAGDAMPPAPPAARMPTPTAAAEETRGTAPAPAPPSAPRPAAASSAAPPATGTAPRPAPTQSANPVAIESVPPSAATSTAPPSVATPTAPPAVAASMASTPAAAIAPPTAAAPLPPAAPPARLLELGVNGAGMRLAERTQDGARVILVPGGTYRRGSSLAPDEGPESDLAVSSFWLDETEVTWAQWRAYMRANAIQLEKAPSFRPGPDHPVVNVDWDGAARYCAWAGGRLPTEAEWEFAARGTSSRVYPWGRSWKEDLANWAGEGDGFANTAPVGSFPAGAGPFGHLDLAGNAAEWVADWHAPGGYAPGVLRDPTGPSSGAERAVRGGSYNSKSPDQLRSARRGHAPPGTVYANYGIRCAMDP